MAWPPTEVEPQYFHAGSICLPRVSVIVTNYNYERYIYNCLSSVLNQSYRNIEIIFVDDMSTDDSWETISDIIANDSRFSSVKTLRSCSSIGQTGAAALGLKECCGSYVILLDADDILLPRCIETHIYAHLSSRLAVGFSSVDCFIINDTEIITGKCSQHNADFIASQEGRLLEMFRPINEVSKVWPISDEPPVKSCQVHYVLPPKCEPWVWSAMSGHCFRRDALELFLRGPLPGLKTGTDGFLVKPITALCGSMIIDSPLMGYRVHGQNAFTTSPPLINMNSYGNSQIERMIEVDKRSINQMLLNIDLFATVCVSASAYFQAIEQLCLSWPINSAQGEIGYFSQIIKTYKDNIVKAFGNNELLLLMKRIDSQAQAPSVPFYKGFIQRFQKLAKN